MLQIEFTRIDAENCDSVRTLHIKMGEGKSLELNQDVEGFNGEISKNTYSVADAQDIGFMLASTFKKAQTLQLHIDEEAASLFSVEAWVKWVSFGMALSTYNYKHTESLTLQPVISQFELNSDQASLNTAFEQGQILAKSQLISRELMNKPGNVIYPVSFVQAVQELAIDKIALSYLDDKAMLDLGFGGLMGIAQGSDREARLLCMDYHPEQAEKTIVLVGKGVTFDSGGISIKQARFMSTMKVDMGGAAAVTGAMNAIANLNVPVRVIGLCGLVENMPSGNAVKPGDVVTMASGKSVEIITTDAEGRMVLADVLHYAQQTYNPDYLIDIATLTGATGISLGKAYASLMGNDENLMTSAQEAGLACSEPLWAMPTGHDLFEASLKSDFADLRHGSEEPDGSACVAATFLRHFVSPEQKWIHIDSAAMSLGMNHRKIYGKAASGYGALLLTELCQHLVSTEQKNK
ncbi:M17 family metallopeptidase [Enterovibrio norvegicus]|uniref:M17 family metallopeptidase n=1 Tax=Enterovibrio norvegicus TaxID=188144 RepID=UPI000C83584A|nr:leucyl aminopeptidase family protein [Enterovibrio norvegicus]PMI35348.1 leucyl aminopeptidase [Enterovibrio norvegicus]